MKNAPTTALVTAIALATLIGPGWVIADNPDDGTQDTQGNGSALFPDAGDILDNLASGNPGGDDD